MDQPRLTDEFCCTYDGSYPASHWLKRLEFELRVFKTAGTIPPELYLSAVNLLLEGDAANWANSSYDINTILTGPYTSEALDKCLSLFNQRFPTKFVEPVTTSFAEELRALRQNIDESLTSYYQRTIELTNRLGARDRLPDDPPLSPIESLVLGLIYNAFLRGLSNQELQQETIRSAVTGISLHSAFVAMEQAHKTRVMIQKIEYEKVRSREAVFYKDVVKRNMSATKLESMWASYSAGNGVPDDGKVPQQFLLPPSNSERSSQSAKPESKSRVPRCIFKKESKSRVP